MAYENPETVVGTAWTDNPSVEIFRQAADRHYRQLEHSEKSRREAEKQIYDIDATGWQPYNALLMAKKQAVIDKLTEINRTHKGFNLSNPNFNNPEIVKAYSEFKALEQDLRNSKNASENLRIKFNKDSADLKNTNKYTARSIEQKKKELDLIYNHPEEALNNLPQFSDLEERHNYNDDIFKMAKNLGYKYTAKKVKTADGTEYFTNIDKITAEEDLQNYVAAYMSSPSGIQQLDIDFNGDTKAQKEYVDGLMRGTIKETHKDLFSGAGETSQRGKYGGTRSQIDKYSVTTNPTEALDTLSQMAMVTSNGEEPMTKEEIAKEATAIPKYKTTIVPPQSKAIYAFDGGRVIGLGRMDDNTNDWEIILAMPKTKDKDATFKAIKATDRNIKLWFEHSAGAKDFMVENGYWSEGATTKKEVASQPKTLAERMRENAK